jgi:phage gp16-like protein
MEINMPNRCISRKQIGLLHVAKAELGLSDEVYREMLGSVGVLSSVQLTGPQFDEVMRRMEAGGFRVVRKRNPPQPPFNKGGRKGGFSKGGQRSAPAQDRAPLLGKIEALLADMGLTWTYADGIARRMWGTDQVAWCNPRQLRAVVAALVKRQKKLQGLQGPKGARHEM